MTATQQVEFSVNTIPVGKARPRVTTAGGYARAYTPAATKAFEKEIAAAYQNKYKTPAFTDGEYLCLDVLIKMPMPKSFTKKQRAAALSGELLPAKKPDVDNIVKAICDALNNTCYTDDNQIVQLSAKKIYAENPGLEIKIKET